MLAEISDKVPLKVSVVTSNFACFSSRVTSFSSKSGWVVVAARMNMVNLLYKSNNLCVTQWESDRTMPHCGKFHAKLQKLYCISPRPQIIFYDHERNHPNIVCTFHVKFSKTHCWISRLLFTAWSEQDFWCTYIFVIILRIFCLFIRCHQKFFYDHWENIIIW